MKFKDISNKEHEIILSYKFYNKHWKKIKFKNDNEMIDWFDKYQNEIEDTRLEKD